MRITAVLLLVSPLFLLGCSAPGPNKAWVMDHGGTLAGAGPRQARADAALHRLIRGHPEIRAAVRVLASDSVGAYSWRNGEIFVTAGLVDRVTQDELVAALAHELGHLLGDGHVHAVVSLRGCDRDCDAEVRADAVGIKLLRVQGLEPQSMIGLLEKTRASASLSESCERAIDDRIQILRQRLRQQQ